MSADHRRSMAALVVALVFCLLGAGCGSGESPPSDARRGEVAEAPGQANDSDRMEPGPSRLEYGIPIGWSLDQPGAEAAALAFVRSTSVIARSGPLTRRDAVLTMATSSFGPAMLRWVNDELSGLTVGTDSRAVAPGELVWHEFPLTVASTMTSSTSAEVRVWSVLIVGIEGGSVARQVWRTSTVTLEVERGDWKVADWTDQPGPSPVAVNDTDLASVAEVGEVTSWTTVGVGS